MEDDKQVGRKTAIAGPARRRSFPAGKAEAALTEAVELATALTSPERK